MNELNDECKRQKTKVKVRNNFLSPSLQVHHPPSEGTHCLIEGYSCKNFLYLLAFVKNLFEAARVKLFLLF